MRRVAQLPDLERGTRFYPLCLAEAVHSFAPELNVSLARVPVTVARPEVFQFVGAIHLQQVRATETSRHPGSERWGQVKT